MRSVREGFRRHLMQLIHYGNLRPKLSLRAHTLILLTIGQLKYEQTKNALNHD